MLLVELTNDFKKRGNLVPVEELKNKDFSKDQWFRSVYLFDNNIIKHMETTGSVARYDGIVYPEFIPIDIDNHPKVLTVDILRSILLDLSDLGIDLESDIHIYFSGRGFHVILPVQLFGFQPSAELPTIVKATMINLFGNNIDTAIYDKLRLFRLPNSINKKTGLYKIPITIQEAFNRKIEYFKELAKEPRNMELPDLSEVEPKLKKRVIHPKLKIQNGFSVHTYKFHCIHSMLAEKPEPGYRHNYLLRLASHFKREGYAPHLTRTILKDWVGKDFPEIELYKIVEDIYKAEYNYSCQDPILKSRCSKDCIFYKASTIINANEMAKELYEHLSEEHKPFSLSSFGINFDIYPGELVTFLGRPGSGKSTFVQNLISNNKEPVLYGSFEMSAQQVYRRQLQIEFGIEKGEAIRKVRQDPTFGTQELSHLWITTRSFYVNDLGRIIESIPVNPRIVIIDHILLMQSRKSSEYETIKEITGGLKQFALKYNKIVLAISQVSREEAKKSGLQMSSGKGNSSIEQDSDKIIAIDRSPYSDVMRVHSEKDREGQSFDRILKFDRKTLKIKPEEKKYGSRNN